MLGSQNVPGATHFGAKGLGADAVKHTLDVFHAGLAVDAMGAAVEPDQALMEAGLDSLAAVELRTAVATTFGVAMPVTLALDYPTLRVRNIHHADPRLHIAAGVCIQALRVRRPAPRKIVVNAWHRLWLLMWQTLCLISPVSSVLQHLVQPMCWSCCKFWSGKRWRWRLGTTSPSWR